MSNEQFDEWLPSLLASKTRKVQAPTPPHGYGTDIAMTISDDGVLDLDPLRRQVTGLDGIFQSLVRRLTTPNGRLRRHRSYGTDILALLNKGITQTLLSTVPALVEREVRKDARVDTVKCVARQSDSNTMLLEIVVMPRKASERFTAVFSVDGTGRLTAELVK